VKMAWMKMERLAGVGDPNGPPARDCVFPKSGELMVPLGVPRFTILKMFMAPPIRVRLYLRETEASNLGCACAPLRPRPFTLPFPPPCGPPGPLDPSILGPIPITLLTRM